MHLQSKNRHLKTAVLLGILAAIGSISSANAGGTRHKYVVHDIYIVDTRPPLVNPATGAVAPGRCDTPTSSPVAAPNGNYSMQHKFLVNDSGMATSQRANPNGPGQQVQMNYYDQ